MTLERLKRIEVIAISITTLLLIFYAWIAGWLLENIVEAGKEIYFLRFVRFIYGLLAITFAPILLLTVRKMNKKNNIPIVIFLISLPFTSTLLGFFVISMPLMVIVVGLAGASQGSGGPPWPLGLHIGLSVIVGVIFSLFLAFLVRGYIVYRNQVEQANESPER